MKYVFSSWNEAMSYANWEAYKTGVRHRVSIGYGYVDFRVLFRVNPITRPMTRVTDWPEKIRLGEPSGSVTRGDISYADQR